MDLRELEKKIGYSFKNKDLLLEAITHSSYTNEHKNSPNNERLEFLGDAILQYSTTIFLYKHYSDSSEGILSKYRAILVNTLSLSKISSSMELKKYVRVSTGQKNDINTKNSKVLLADVVEAIIGAIYLDSSLEQSEKFIYDFINKNAEEIIKVNEATDYKTRFQEAVQSKTHITPSYKVIFEEGPDHQKKFVIGVYIDDVLISEGKGESKQEAQQNAAYNAIKKNIY